MGKLTNLLKYKVACFYRKLEIYTKILLNCKTSEKNIRQNN